MSAGVFSAGAQRFQRRAPTGLQGAGRTNLHVPYPIGLQLQLLRCSIPANLPTTAANYSDKSIVADAPSLPLQARLQRISRLSLSLRMYGLPTGPFESVRPGCQARNPRRHASSLKPRASTASFSLQSRSLLLALLLFCSSTLPFGGPLYPVIHVYN